MNKTSIEWTDFTANPLKYRDAAGRVVWGCVHHSPGCVNCYAETLAKRYGKGGPFNVPTTSKLTPFLDEAELHKMLTYKPASGKRVFVGDMTDIFGEWVSDELLSSLFCAFAMRSDVTWQVLTKRAGRMREFFEKWTSSNLFTPLAGKGERPGSGWTWPLPNVWLGVSAEDQPRANERIPLLLRTPAAVRFISAEPLLSRTDFTRVQLANHGFIHALGGSVTFGPDDANCFRPIDWVIVGGESGPAARPCHTDWIADVARQCAASGVPCFVKQLGSNGYQLPGGVRLRDRKGGDPSEWPEDLRVREFPKVKGEGLTG